MHVNTLTGNTWEEVEAQSNIVASAAPMINKHTPSFFHKIYNLNSFLYVPVDSDDFEHFLVISKFAVAKHEKSQNCNKTTCIFLIFFHGGNIEQTLSLLDYNFEKVNCHQSNLNFTFYFQENFSVCMEFSSLSPCSRPSKAVVLTERRSVCPAHSGGKMVAMKASGRGTYLN